MAAEADRQLRIKKYPNRRFYDSTRGRHLTLSDLHDLVCEGFELVITDSQSGQDITHQVLTQIILERDPPKLEIFPSNILHQMIRTQQQLLGGVVEQYFRQVLQAQQASQQRWAEFWNNTLGFVPIPAIPGGMAGLMDWARLFGRSAESGPTAPTTAAETPPGQSPSGERGTSMEDDDAGRARRQNLDVREDSAATRSPRAAAPAADLETMQRQIERLERELGDLRRRSRPRKK